MKTKKIILPLVLGILLISFAFASGFYSYTTRWFYGGNPVNGIRAVNYICSDSGCHNLGTGLSDQTSATNSITINYPVPSPQYGYATYWVSDCFRAEKLAIKPSNQGSDSVNVNFLKYSNCNASIEDFSFNQEINQSQVLEISADIKSAIAKSLVAPYADPQEADIIQDFLSAQTNIVLEIRDSSNNIIYTETRQEYILHDSEKPLSYSWDSDNNPAGNYNITLTTNVVDCKCKTNVQKKVSRILTITANQTSPPTPISTTTNVIANPASPITNGTLSNFSCSNSAGQTTVMRVNGVDKTSEKGLNISREVGNYTINCSFAGNANYEASSQQITYIILNQTTPPQPPISTTTNVIVNPSSPITYGTLSNFSCSNSQGQPTTLTINGVNKNIENGLNILRAAGTYIINCSFAGNSNYEASSQQISYVINKISPPGFNLNLNAIPAWLVNNGTQTTVIGTGCPSQLTCSLTRNSASVSNPDIATLAIGLYNYNYSTLGNENYTSASISNTLNITYSSTDITPPIITIISPENQTYPDNNISFIVNISEPGTCSLELDNQTYYMLNSSTVDWFLDYLHNLVIVSGCSHKVKYTCSDIFGNTAQTGYVYFSINFTGCFNQTDNDDNDTDDNCNDNFGISTKHKLSISLPLLTLKPINDIAHFRVIIRDEGSKDENGLITLQIQDLNFKRTMDFSVDKNAEETTLFDIPITNNMGKVKAKITLEYAGKSEDYYYNLNVDNNLQTGTASGENAEATSNSGSNIGITGNVIKTSSDSTDGSLVGINILLFLIIAILAIILILKKRK